MVILGIDPGYDRLGIAIVEKDAGKKDKKETVLYSACLETSPKDTIYNRFKLIGAEVSRVIREHSPDALAIENLFITKNQKTAMRVSEARGIVIYEAAKRDIPIFEYTPMQIKTAITGDGTSDKNRMIKMIPLLVNLPIKLHASKPHASKMLDDEYDAIAVALTHIACAR